MQWAGLTGCEGNCGSHTDASSCPSCCSELSDLRVSVCTPQMGKHHSRGPCAQPSSPPAVSLSSPEKTNYHDQSIQVILNFSLFSADHETAPEIPTGVLNLCICPPTLAHWPPSQASHPSAFAGLCPLLHDGLCTAGPVTSLLRKIPLGPYLLSQWHLSLKEVCASPQLGYKAPGGGTLALPGLHQG